MGRRLRSPSFRFWDAPLYPRPLRAFVTLAIPMGGLFPGTSVLAQCSLRFWVARRPVISFRHCCKYSPSTDRIRSRGAGVWRPAFRQLALCHRSRLAVATGLTGACTLAFICYAAATLVAAFHFLAHPFQSGLAASAPAWLNNGALREPGTLVIWRRTRMSLQRKWRLVSDGPADSQQKTSLLTAEMHHSQGHTLHLHTHRR